LRARKRFGQHFLTDANVLARIVAAVNVKETEKLLEIGPGHGALTQLLYPHAGTFAAVEIDRDLIAMLRARFPDLTLINADILSVDMTSVLAGGHWRLVGNLPYNISSPLLLKLFAHLPLIKDMHFMFQRELSQRLAAVPGTKDWGRLSVLTQYHCQVQPLFDVAPEAFNPPPKVHSQVIRLVPRADKPVVDEEVLRRVLRTAFSSRRKRLSNGLKLFALDWDQLPVTPDQRPDMLSVEDYVMIAQAVAVTEKADRESDGMASERESEGG
jgi:16S rRNA (adenine1518-N6/adenine1519-N6)-dimethyltransferase